MELVDCVILYDGSEIFEGEAELDEQTGWGCFTDPNYLHTYQYIEGEYHIKLGGIDKILEISIKSRKHTQKIWFKILDYM